MHGLYRQVVGIYIALQVHEAADIGTDHVLCAGVQCILHLALGHTYRYGLILNGEGAAKAAAGLALLHIEEGEAGDVLQQHAWTCAYAALTQGAAGIVVGSLAIEGGANVLYLKHLGKELGKLEGIAGDLAAEQMVGPVLEHLVVVVADKAGAGAAGADDVALFLKVLQEFAGHIGSLVLVAGVIGGLAAAGLVFVVSDLTAEFLEHLHHVHPCLGVELVDKARYKKLYVQS